MVATPSHHARRPSLAHGRAKARRAALQALYQWFMAGHNLQDIETQFLVEQDMRGVEIPYFRELLHKVPFHLQELEAYLAPLLDRPLEDLDPVERSILRIGAYELYYRLDIPYRVVINEGVELAKRFGAEQSYRYVNGILDKLAHKLRTLEIKGQASDRT